MAGWPHSSHDDVGAAHQTGQSPPPPDRSVTPFLCPLMALPPHPPHPPPSHCCHAPPPPSLTARATLTRCTPTLRPWGPSEQQRQQVAPGQDGPRPTAQVSWVGPVGPEHIRVCVHALPLVLPHVSWLPMSHGPPCLMALHGAAPALIQHKCGIHDEAIIHVGMMRDEG